MKRFEGLIVFKILKYFVRNFFDVDCGENDYWIYLRFFERFLIGY